MATASESSPAQKKYVCEICGTEYNKDIEVNACRRVHYNCSRIIVKLENNDLQEVENPTDDSDAHYKTLLSEQQDEESTNFKKKKVDDPFEGNIEGNTKVRRVYVWTREITAKLVELLKTHYDFIDDKYNSRGRASFWRIIHNELWKLDSNLSLSQVRKKWNNMVAHYRKYHRVTKMGTHSKMKKPDFLDEIGDILGPDGLATLGLTEVECETVPDLDLNLDSDTDSDADADLDQNQNQNQTQTPKSSRLHEFKTSLGDAVKLIYESEMLDEESCDPENTATVLRKKGDRRKRQRPATRTESVEKAILQLVETNKSALEADKEKTKFLKDQLSQQESFDTQFLRAYRQRNEAIENNTKVVEEFKDMLKLHLKTVLEVDIRTKKIEKFLENNL